MTLLGLTFTSPLILLGLLTLPIIWYLLRLTPPRPAQEIFPPIRILEQIAKPEETPAQSPWWLTILRLLLAALVIFALAEPVKNALTKTLTGEGPVLIVLDNGWTSGANWNARKTNAEALIREAAKNSRTVTLAVPNGASTPVPQSADDALRSLAAVEPMPLVSDFGAIANWLSKSKSGFGSAIWLNGDAKQNGETDLISALSKAPQIQLVAPKTKTSMALLSVNNQPDALMVELGRTNSTTAHNGKLKAYDLKGRALSTTKFAFTSNQSSINARIVLPVELRNEVARIEIENSKTAGGVQLLDDSFQRRKVGLITGENADRAQPLLSPLYYISRALSPYSEIREPTDRDVAKAVKQLIDERINTLVLADIGKVPDDSALKIQNWVETGGMLIRFAGPRLAAAQDDLLVPVILRRGGRNLGGTLTWGTPQPLAAFSETSPFAGMNVPKDVVITRQVLAEPSVELAGYTWASLADGTPLVTAAQHKKGWIVLFHVTADASWSNLPLSGAFVEMLRKIVAVSSRRNSATEIGGNTSTLNSEITTLPPLKSIDGFGRLGPAAPLIQPIKITKGKRLVATDENHPGLYGTAEAFVALNLFSQGDKITPFDRSTLPANTEYTSYQTEAAFEFKPYLLAIAVLLLTLDCIAVLWMAGAFKTKRHPTPAALSFMIALLIGLTPTDVRAQDSSIDFTNTLKTRLAYVVTGLDELDEISRKGLTGLTSYVSSRTSLEPGNPVGVDISSDELAFFPLLYWPLSSASPIPNAATMARVENFMKRGGSVIFDTRDQLTGGFGGSSVSPATLKLRQILSNLDIPPLEPVPDNHVLTRAFYLLDIFPGRYLDGRLWVESSEDNTGNSRPTRQGDGVSSIMITSNDLAGAWAIEADGAPSLPTVPPNPTQRTYAYRTGVNILMYTLTGNYKSDQVHIPALLERLGQ